MLDSRPAREMTRPIGATPAPALRPYVQSYRLFVGTEGREAPRWHFPSELAPLFVGLEGSGIFNMHAGEREDLLRAPVVGFRARPVASRTTAGFKGVQVNFTPLGAYRFFGMPMHELGSGVSELDDVLGEGRIMAERLEAAGIDEAWPAALDEIIGRRFAGTSAAPRGIVAGWAKLRASGGTAPIASLVDQSGASHRHFIAEFRRCIGLPPKTAARVLRFESARKRLEQREGCRLADVAADCGYTDESHLIRDFRSFAGMSPGQYVASRLPDGHVATEGGAGQVNFRLGQTCRNP